MSEQTTILFFLIVGLGITILLYIWKAKKEIEYKKDERWLLIQSKANNAANISNCFLIILLAVGSMIPLFSDTQITFTLNRVCIYGILFIALRNAIEISALKYFDNKL